MPLQVTQKEADLADAYFTVFTTDPGKRVLVDLLEQCHLVDETPDGEDRLSLVGVGPIDPYRTHVRVGHLEIGHYVRRQLEIGRTKDREIATTKPGLDPLGREEQR